MPIQDYRDLAQTLNDRIKDSNDLRIWQESADRAGNQAGGVMPPWQREILSKLLAIGEPIEYLSVQYFETEALRLIAFTSDLVVDARTVSLSHGEFKLDTFNLGRRSEIGSVSIDSVDSVPFDSTDWPGRISLTLTLAGGTATLPLDRHASRGNVSALVGFYPSLLRGFGASAR